MNTNKGQIKDKEGLRLGIFSYKGSSIYYVFNLLCFMFTSPSAINALEAYPRFKPEQKVKIKQLSERRFK